MVWKLTIFLGLAWCCLAHDHHAVSYQNLIQHYHPEHHGHHGELSHIGSHVPEQREEYAWTYPAYEYSYNVDDPHTHDHKGQHEVRDGDTVKGMYWLIQPDGRKRTVTYYADQHHGFKAHVEYSDPYHPVPNHPVPHHPEPHLPVPLLSVPYLPVPHHPVLHYPVPHNRVPHHPVPHHPVPLPPVPLPPVHLPPVPLPPIPIRYDTKIHHNQLPVHHDVHGHQNYYFKPHYDSHNYYNH